MAYLEWQPGFSVGHSRIDRDHQALVAAINELYLAAHEGRAKEEVAKLLNFLRDYTVTHFGMEEALMIRHKYPEASTHFAAHAELIVQVSEFIAAYRNGTSIPVEAMQAFLNGWLVNHIQGCDRDLGAYLQARRVEG